MVSLTPNERVVVDSLLSCLATAIRQSGDVDPAFANKTKIQKLLYLAIDEFGLPVTHSWYLAGAVVPTDQATPMDLETAFDEVGADAGEAIAHQEDSALAEYLSPGGEIDPLDPVLFTDNDGADPTDGSDDKHTIVDDNREEIVNFYVENLPDVWHQSTMRFLQNFYLEFAPEEYREVYVYSTHLRIHLQDIEEVIESRMAGTEPEQAIPSLIENVGLVISDLHTAIRSTEAIADTLQPVVAGTDIIEDGLMMLERKAPDEFVEAHLEAVRSMQEFYYYVVWRYPCLIISKETARGPSATAVRTQRDEQLDGFEETLQNRMNELENELAAADLLPGYDDYPSFDDDIDETIIDLTGEYFDK